MMDIVFPNGNEKEFIQMAQRLGHKELVFLYDPGHYDAQLPESKMKLNKGILLDARVLLHNPQKYKKHFVVIKSSDKDREVLETKACSLLFDLEMQPRKDFMHQRASGFNHILAQIAHETKTTIGFSLSSLILSNTKQTILGRMHQNMKLCKKYKVSFVIASFSHDPYGLRSSHDVRSLQEFLF